MFLRVPGGEAAKSIETCPQSFMVPYIIWGVYDIRGGGWLAHPALSSIFAFPRAVPDKLAAKQRSKVSSAHLNL